MKYFDTNAKKSEACPISFNCLSNATYTINYCNLNVHALVVTFEHGDDDEFDPELKQPVIKTV